MLYLRVFFTTVRTVGTVHTLQELDVLPQGKEGSTVCTEQTLTGCEEILPLRMACSTVCMYVLYRRGGYPQRIACSTVL